MGTRTLSRKVAAVAANPGHVAVYCRISEDPSGRKMGVKAQANRGRAYAAQRWPGVPVVVYEDDDLSAAKDDVVRPGWERLREAVRAGQVAHVWAVEQSRLTRREMEWFAFSAELTAAGVTEVHTERDGVLKVGDEIAGIRAVLAAAEVRKLRQRVRDRAEDNAALGIPPGGRHYGYRTVIGANGHKTYEIVESEAAIIRECAERLLSGWALGSIVKNLTARGVAGQLQMKVRDENGQVVTVDGRPLDEGGVPLTRRAKLRPGTVKLWLTSPMFAGKRTLRGEIVADANWPPILDEATWRACRQALSGPRPVRVVGGPLDGMVRTYTGKVARQGRRYLLTGADGLTVCGKCGVPLVAFRKQEGGKAVELYACATARGGCGGVTMRAARLESEVVDAMLAKLSNPEFVAMVGADLYAPERDRLGREIAALDPQRAELARLWAKRQITAQEWMQAKQGISEEEARLRGELAALPEPAGDLDPALIVKVWPVPEENGGMTLDERRHTIRRFVERVTVNRIDRTKLSWGQDRVVIDWRQV